jgi:hypothetical protein
MTPVAKTAAASAGFYVDEQERIWGDPAYDISLQCLTLVELIVLECADVVADAVDIARLGQLAGIGHGNGRSKS